MIGRILKFLIPLVLLVVFAVGLMYSLRTEPVLESAAKTLKSPQQAAAPLGLPVGDEKRIPPIDSRAHLFDGFTRAKIPVADHFEYPLGDRNGAFSYNAQGFLEHNTRRGGYHLGDDLNGIGGQNTDLGDPVYCAADGMVVYAAKPSAGWGNVMVIAHKLKDGRLIQTLYAHLKEMNFVVDDIVGRGNIIGTVGNADGAYYAHLHYEIRESDGLFIGPGYSGDKKEWGEQLDPEKFLSEYNTKAHHEVGESALKMMVDAQREKIKNMIRSAPIDLEQ